MALTIPAVALSSQKARSASVNTYDCTFGAASLTVEEQPNRIQAMRFVNSEGTGILNTLRLYIACDDYDTNYTSPVRMGVYADSSGKPGRLLLDAGETPINTSNGWIEIKNLNLPVSKGQSYWLAFNLKQAYFVAYMTGQAANSHVWGASAYGPLPAVFPRISYTNNSQYLMQAQLTKY